ncbi:MAG: HD domain-containing protein [Desulfobacterales bacterium]|jgi:(p)ppGpp synthase/HD superfamily hydrolase
MSPWSREKYIRAYRFAAEAHRGQTLPGIERPYIVHPTLVAMEIIALLSIEPGWDGDLALQTALLHDVLEDSDRKVEEIETRFGKPVADGVQALTKNVRIEDRRERLAENLERIRKQPWEIWLVKMADRLTNLAAPPPIWTSRQVAEYRKEAVLIHRALGKANPFLARRLSRRIAAYPPRAGYGAAAGQTVTPPE